MTSLSVVRYRRMLRMRYFELACLEGVSTREIHGELHTGVGQEAIAAAMQESLRPGDAVVSTHRNHGHALAKGVDPLALMAEIYEKASGLCGGYGGHMHPFDPTTNFSATGLVGASLPVALGYAYGFALRGENHVAVAITGDGGTNIGGFHETLNMAGVWKLPFVLVIENNGYGISVPIATVSASSTLAERSVIYRAWSRTVDGMDVDVVAQAFSEAMEHARSGQGPAILEAICHRHRGHFEGDHDTYREQKEKQRLAAECDPLLLGRDKMLKAGITDAGTLERMEAEVKEEMFGLLAQVRALAYPQASAALRHVFVELP